MKTVAWQDKKGVGRQKKVGGEGRRQGADKGSIYYGE